MSEPRATTTRRRRFSVDALFADTSPRATGVSDLIEAKQIQLDRIEADPNQPRKEFDPESLDELAASIRSDGVLQPIAVRYDDERDAYVVVHGERRLRAARLAGLEVIPAVVRDVPEDRRLLQQLAENIVREDLNALDRAAALRALKARMGDASWERVAEAVGIRRSRLFQLLGTEKLADPLQEALRRGIVSEKQTRAAQSLPEEIQSELGHNILDGSLDPRMIETAVRGIRSSGGRSGSNAMIDRSGHLVSAARRQARALSSTLGEIGNQGLSALSPRDANQLAGDLRAARERLDEALSALDSDT